jgi:hypothetical protein
MQWLAVDSVIPDAEYALDVEIQKTPDRLRLNPVSLVWGRSDYSGTVDIQPGVIPTINAVLQSRYVSLPFLLPDLRELEEEERAREAEGRQASTGLKVEPLTSKELKERVISDQPLDFSWMRQFQGTLSYRLDELYLSPKAFASVNLDVSLAEGVLSTREMRWDGTFQAGVSDITLRALEEGAEVALDLNFERVPLMFLLGGEPEYEAGSYYRAHFKARGKSFQEMAKTANGALLFKAGGGRLDNGGMDLILGDTVDEVLSRLNPFSQTEPVTQVVCHAGAMSIKNGTADIVPGLVLRTDKLDMAFGGAIDLHKEKLNLVFNTRSRKGIGISASKAITPYFKLGGTLAYPRVALDVKGAAVSAGAAVATAGLSILAEGLWDRWVATAKNPCEGLISQLSKDKSETYRSLLER